MAAATVSVTWLKSAGLQIGVIETVPLATAETMAMQGLAKLTTPPAESPALDHIFWHHGRKDV